MIRTYINFIRRRLGDKEVRKNLRKRGNHYLLISGGVLIFSGLIWGLLTFKRLMKYLDSGPGYSVHEEMLDYMYTKELKSNKQMANFPARPEFSHS